VALVSADGALVRDIEHPAQRNRFAYAPAIALGALAAALGL
jgi:prepilin signal peptidase PulO-like enzyme (type II secretory pathway)